MIDRDIFFSAAGLFLDKVRANRVLMQLVLNVQKFSSGSTLLLVDVSKSVLIQPSERRFQCNNDMLEVFQIRSLFPPIQSLFSNVLETPVFSPYLTKLK